MYDKIKKECLNINKTMFKFYEGQEPLSDIEKFAIFNFYLCIMSIAGTYGHVKEPLKKPLKALRMYPVESSNIDAYGYDGPNGELYIRFRHGGLYRFENVHAWTVRNFELAKSKGKFFHENIKGQYKSEKIEEIEEEKAEEKVDLPTMYHATPSSPTLNMIGYDQDAHHLYVQFKKGELYKYVGVPQEKWNSLFYSEDTEDHFNKYIRGQYIYQIIKD